MKKTYIAPVSSSIAIVAEQMIAASSIKVDSSKSTNDRFSQEKKDMWGKNGMWN